MCTCVYIYIYLFIFIYIYIHICLSLCVCVFARVVQDSFFSAACLRTGRVHVQLEDCLKALRPRNLKVMRSLHDVNEMMDRVLQVFESVFAESPGGSVPCCGSMIHELNWSLQQQPRKHGQSHVQLRCRQLLGFCSHEYSTCHDCHDMSQSTSYIQLPGNGDGVLDVNEFERCLEGIGLQLGNVDLDEIQQLKTI